MKKFIIITGLILLSALNISAENNNIQKENNVISLSKKSNNKITYKELFFSKNKSVEEKLFQFKKERNYNKIEFLFFKIIFGLIVSIVCIFSIITIIFLSFLLFFKLIDLINI